MRATVEGASRYVTQLRLSGTTITAACTCPVGARGEFCKHAVAVALQLIDEPAEREADPDIPAPRMLRSTRGASRTAGAPAGLTDVAACKAQLQAAFRVGHLDWRRTGAWALTAYHAIDAIEALIQVAPRDAVKLCEYALKRCDAVYQRVDDSGGEISDLIGRAQQLHLTACQVADEPPGKLAKRLYAIETGSDLDLLVDVYTDYAGVLGDAGLAEYRELAERDWAELRGVSRDSSDWDLRSRRWAVTRVLEQVARADRDVNRIVEVVGDGFTTSWDYVQVARACLEIDELDAALHWARAGFDADPRDRRIVEELTDVHVARGEGEQGAEELGSLRALVPAPRARSCAALGGLDGTVVDHDLLRSEGG